MKRLKSAVRAIPIIGALVVAMLAHAAFWAGTTAPFHPDEAPGRLQSISYSPSGRDHDGESGDILDADHIDADMAAIARIADGVRTYTVSAGLDAVPRIAARHGLKVSVGAWVSGDEDRTRREIATAISLANRYQNVVRLVIGNETLLRREVSDGELARLILDVRRKVPARVHVGTSDTWDQMLNAPLSAKASEFIGIHTLPYWEGKPAAFAFDEVLSHIRDVRARYPKAPIWIGEVGWPSNGTNFYESFPSLDAQASLIRGFAKYAKANRIAYNAIEAFDQPWKVAIEGSVGGSWGVMDADRNIKFPLQGIVESPRIEIGIAIAAILAGGLLSLMLTLARFKAGRVTAIQTLVSTTGIHLVTLALALAAVQAASEYTTAGVLVLWIGAGILGLTLAALSFADVDEAALTLFGRQAPRLLKHGVSPDPSVRRPKVSVHVAARNEKPEMMAATLDALAALNYPDWECVVAINNTADKSLVKPVELYCNQLNERLGTRRFIFADFSCTGFKAGALNQALRLTSPDAEIIAVLDADYAVHPEWLDRLAPVFEMDPQIGIIQAPQEHRDGHESWSKRFMSAEYRAFFDSGMIERNEDNALICHGTMIMVRREALVAAGGWSEWCIVEDTELGLKLLQKGWSIHYTTERLGAGCAPDTFKDFRQQRHRWAYGSVQIMKAHFRSVLPGATGLSTRQKVQFAVGWARWWADAVGLLAAVMGIAWTIGATFFQLHLPPSSVTLAAIAAIGVRALASMALTRWASGHSWRDTLGTALIGMSLSTTVGRAILKGIFSKHEPFKVTSKGGNNVTAGASMGAGAGAGAGAGTDAAAVPVPVRKKASACFAAKPELFLTLVLLAAAIQSIRINWVDTVELNLWACLLVLMAVPNICAVLFALRDLLPTLSWSRLPLLRRFTLRQTA